MTKAVRFATVISALSVLGGTKACAEDRILPVLALCGDSSMVGNEECDTDSPGCVSCRVAEGWECAENQCWEICGDSRVVGAEECDPPDGRGCDQSCRSADRSHACNMTGYWIVRQTDFSSDLLFGALQTANAWYVYRFSQEGDTFTTEASLSCSVTIAGSVTVRPRASGQRALLYSQDADGSNHRPPRRGTFKQVGDGCEFSFQRWYLRRGLNESFLPEDFSTHTKLEDLPRPMPETEDPLDLTLATPAGVVDMDGDGRPGISFQITGNVTGLRHSAQRDWNEYVTDAETWPIPTHAVEFTTRSLFKNQETILFVEECGGACKLLTTGSAPSLNEPSRVTFRYLGLELEDPRVAAVIVAPLYEDEDADLATCEKVRAALPLTQATE